MDVKDGCIPDCLEKVLIHALLIWGTPFLQAGRRSQACGMLGDLVQMVAATCRQTTGIVYHAWQFLLPQTKYVQKGQTVPLYWDECWQLEHCTGSPMPDHIYLSSSLDWNWAPWFTNQWKPDRENNRYPGRWDSLCWQSAFKNKTYWWNIQLQEKNKRRYGVGRRAFVGLFRLNDGRWNT